MHSSTFFEKIKNQRTRFTCYQVKNECSYKKVFGKLTRCKINDRQKLWLVLCVSLLAQPRTQ